MLLDDLEREYGVTIHLNGHVALSNARLPFTFEPAPAAGDDPRAALLAYLRSPESFLKSAFGRKYLGQSRQELEWLESAEDFVEANGDEIEADDDSYFVDESRPDYGVVRFCKPRALAGELRFAQKRGTRRKRPPGFSGELSSLNKAGFERAMRSGFVMAAGAGQALLMAGKWSFDLHSIEEDMFTPIGKFFLARPKDRSVYEGVVFHFSGGH